MIKVYVTPNCLSSRKTLRWFERENIPFKEINLNSHRLTKADIREMLMKSLDGTEEIISTKSKACSNLKKDIDSMSLDELYRFIQENPTILKRPIIVSDHMLQVGYNPDDIEIFQRAKIPGAYL